MAHRDNPSRSQGRTLALIAAAFAVLVVAAGATALLLLPEEGAVPDPEAASYTSPYDWQGLSSQDGRFFYSEEGVAASRLGIDVSEHQGVIDWEAVAADGIEFALIRLGNRGATEGGIYLDRQFGANIAGAREAGIEVGVYFFSQAINEEEAREEAAFVIQTLGGRLPLTTRSFSTMSRSRGLGGARGAPTTCPARC